MPLPVDVHPLLAQPEQAPLGRVRLLAPFGPGLQIHPADDRIVLLDVRIDRAEPPGTVTAEASHAIPVSPDLAA